LNFTQVNNSITHVTNTHMDHNKWPVVCNAKIVPKFEGNISGWYYYPHIGYTKIPIHTENTLRGVVSSIPSDKQFKLEENISGCDRDPHMDHNKWITQQHDHNNAHAKKVPKIPRHTENTLREVVSSIPSDKQFKLEGNISGCDYDPHMDHNTWITEQHDHNNGVCYNADVKKNRPRNTENTLRKVVSSIPSDKNSKLKGNISGWDYDFTSIKGRRPTMEDSHLAVGIDSCDLEIFAIFDGHGGNAVADKVIELLPKTVEKVVKQYLKDRPRRFTPKLATLIPTIFKQTDQLLLKHLSAAETSSGATAAVIITHDSKIYCAHIGDSRIMLFSKFDENIYNSPDHKVRTPSEKYRIEKAGGYVANGRITTPGSFRGLNVARAFGDFQFKKRNEADQNPDSVSVVPYIEVFDEADVGGILVMCDGVTDVLEDERIFEIYRDRKSGRRDLAEFLVMDSFRNGSTDNISACFLRS